MFVKDFSRYVVLKMEDVNNIAPIDRSYLDRAIRAVKVQRLKRYKPQREYVVVSNSNPELYDKVWELIKEAEANEQTAQSTTP